jgi:hypothetical protein
MLKGCHDLHRDQVGIYTSVQSRFALESPSRGLLPDNAACSVTLLDAWPLYSRAAASCTPAVPDEARQLLDCIDRDGRRRAHFCRSIWADFACTDLHRMIVMDI